MRLSCFFVLPVLYDREKNYASNGIWVYKLVKAFSLSYPKNSKIGKNQKGFLSDRFFQKFEKKLSCNKTYISIVLSSSR